MDTLNVYEVSFDVTYKFPVLSDRNTYTYKTRRIVAISGDMAVKVARNCLRSENKYVSIRLAEVNKIVTNVVV